MNSVRAIDMTARRPVLLACGATIRPRADLSFTAG
jgi:hypothetical protein